jgi:hypothetical protein
MSTKTQLTTEQRLRRAFTTYFGKNAEQFPANPTIRKINGGIRVTKTLLSGKARLRHPENGGALKMDGDVGMFGNNLPELNILGLLWRGEWVPVPSTDALMEWTMDSVCPTPDDREVEPDDPDSWLRLLGLV